MMHGQKNIKFPACLKEIPQVVLKNRAGIHSISNLIVYMCIRTKSPLGSIPRELWPLEHGICFLVSVSL